MVPAKASNRPWVAESRISSVLLAPAPLDTLVEQDREDCNAEDAELLREKLLEHFRDVLRVVLKCTAAEGPKNHRVVPVLLTDR